MKVFIYTKSDSRKIATLTGCKNMRTEGNTVYFELDDGVEVSFDTKAVKSTCYQN